MTGILIVIDGGDAAGKKTQTALLVERLKKEGNTVHTLDFPQYESFFGKLVARYLRGEFGSLDEVKPELVSLLYALDRFDQADVIKGWVAEGAIVVLDRYVESNLAYQSAKLKGDIAAFVSWIQELEHGKLGIPKADLVCYLHVPVDVSEKLMADRPDKSYLGGEKSDIHEADRNFQRRVVETYLALSKRMGWKVVECAPDGALLSKEEIAGRLFAAIKDSI
ncbi:MAG: thymidylate kinase [archaeon]